MRRNVEAVAQVLRGDGDRERGLRRIAMDQINPLFAELNAVRLRELGVTHFRWRATKPDPTRAHNALEGKWFSFADLPSVGLPGTATLCGCQAEPVLDWIAWALAAKRPKGRYRNAVGNERG